MGRLQERLVRFSSLDKLRLERPLAELEGSPWITVVKSRRPAP